MSSIGSPIFTAGQVSRHHDRSLFTGGKDHPMLHNDGCPSHPRGSADTKSVAGQTRKSATTILMSVIPPKAEVAIRGADVRYVPVSEVFSALGATKISFLFNLRLLRALVILRVEDHTVGLRAQAGIV